MNETPNITATTTPRPRASAADVLLPAEPVFTARQFGKWLSRSDKAVKQRLPASTRKIEVRGQQANAWPLSCLPSEWIARLEAMAQENGFHGPTDLLNSEPRQRWKSPAAVRFTPWR